MGEAVLDRASAKKRTSTDARPLAYAGAGHVSTPAIPSDDWGYLESQLLATAYVNDLDLWIEDVCGEFIWSKQRAICQSVVKNRRTAVPSCHGPGKSFIASRIAAGWLATHKPGEAFVVTSASVARQVRTILWREINRIHAKAGLAGRVNQTEWYMEIVHPNGRISEEIVGFGIKPDDYNPTAFQGIHQKYVLVIFDEACGIGDLLWDAADSLISNEFGRFLAIGNPDDPDTEFEKVCRPGSGWNVIPISAFDTPNFTGEYVPEEVRYSLVSKVWVEEKKKKWGEENPVYISKVLGQFPESSTDGLIPMKWIRQAQERDLSDQMDDGPNELGVDIGEGGDPNIIGQRRGPVFRIVRKDHEPDTMKTCGHVIQALRETKASRAKIDAIGIGSGVVNRGKELGHPFVAIKVSESATNTEEFANLRAEGFWGLRTRFEEGDIDIDAEDDDLAAQLAALKFSTNSRGQTLIGSKKDLRKDIKRSPDEADVCMLAFIKPPKRGKDPGRATWGSKKKRIRSGVAA